MTFPLSELTITLESESDALLIADALDDSALSTSWTPTDDKKLWILKIHASDTDAKNMSLSVRLIAAAHNISLLQLVESHLKQTNWLYENQHHTDTFNIGHFCIYGPNALPSPAPQHIPIKLDSAVAFGSGNHETTQGCLMMLEHLHNSGLTPENCLDVGTGSGVLAIATQKLWMNAKITASDIDPKSIKTATQNAQENATPNIRFSISNGFQSTQLKSLPPIHLVTANLLLNILTELAIDIASSLAPCGYLVASGILSSQEQRTTRKYESLGLKLSHRIALNDWVTLLFQK